MQFYAQNLLLFFKLHHILRGSDNISVNNNGRVMPHLKTFVPSVFFHLIGFNGYYAQKYNLYLIEIPRYAVYAPNWIAKMRLYIYIWLICSHILFIVLEEIKVLIFRKSCA